MYNMKRIVFFTAIAIGVMMASCSLEQQAQVTPRMGISYPVCSHVESNSTDTLKAILNENGIYKIDSIHQGDTVRFMVALNASPNSLTAFLIEYDSTILSVRIDSTEKLQSGLLDTSDPEHGKLYFNPTCIGAQFPVRYIPLKAGSADIKLTVESDSKYSPYSISLTQPVE